MIEEIIKGKQYTCPICNKAFIATDLHKFITRLGPTCSWKCFLEYVDKNPKSLTYQQQKQIILKDQEKTTTKVSTKQKISYKFFEIQKKVSKKDLIDYLKEHKIKDTLQYFDINYNYFRQLLKYYNIENYKKDCN